LSANEPLWDLRWRRRGGGRERVERFGDGAKAIHALNTAAAKIGRGGSATLVNPDGSVTGLLEGALHVQA